ncbi:unnamed protein product [Linum trigynum]|uniref:Uncharacterized protein n=1 Tax=Linum trigynum TaxID=586398 RepID=A0AAV2EYT9_9ROSI
MVTHRGTKGEANKSSTRPTTCKQNGKSNNLDKGTKPSKSSKLPCVKQEKQRAIIEKDRGKAAKSPPI